MIKVLIVDDNAKKQQKIFECLCKYEENNEVKLYYAQDINGAKRIVSKLLIDLMILDINLPQKFGDKPMNDGGVKFLELIKDSNKYIYPRYVVSLSRYDKSIKLFKENSTLIHSVIKFDEANLTWEMELKKCVEMLKMILENNLIPRTHNYDVAVVCALDEELQFIKDTFAIDCLREIQIVNDDDLYYEGIYLTSEGKKIRVIMTSCVQMGMVSSAVMTTKLIYNFAPKYIVMPGILAGIKPDKVGLGDTIVAEYVWDYGAGKKISTDGGTSRHINSIRQENLDSSIVAMARRIIDDKVFLSDVKKSFLGNKPKTEFMIHLGQVVSGAAVITDIAIAEELKNEQSRDILGLEMEIYGMYHAAKWAIKPKPIAVAIKSVCDYADSSKNDEYHAYAEYTSACVFKELVTKYFEFFDEENL